MLQLYSDMTNQELRLPPQYYLEDHRGYQTLPFVILNFRLCLLDVFFLGLLIQQNDFYHHVYWQY